MPTNIVRIENNKKHMTKKEREERLKAEQSQKRETKVRLTKPDFVKNDDIANGYWDRTRERMAGVGVLDNADADMFGQYCKMCARLEKLYERFETTQDTDIAIRIEATERNLMSYAEKLGLTPSGRARLAKKKAEKKEKDPYEEMYGD